METDGYYHFNRCARCNRMLTKLDLVAALASGADLCPCGGASFRPTNPRWWELWLTVRGLKMVAYRLLGRLTPAPEPSVLPASPFPSNLQSVPAAERVIPNEDGE